MALPLCAAVVARQERSGNAEIGYRLAPSKAVPVWKVKRSIAPSSEFRADG
jgi:hypothetical protein